MAERGVIFKDDFVTAPDKSWFDMSFDFLLSGNFGELLPTTCMECMPEDKIHAKSDSFVRLAPLVSPTFGKVNMFDYHFYVRNRSIWTQWESFIADKDQRKSWQQANPLWTPPEMPYIDIREVLYKEKFTIRSRETSSFGVPDGHGDHIYSIDDGAFSNLSVSYLVIQFETNSDGDIISPHAYISDNEIMAFEFNDFDNCYIIPFLRNKNEQTSLLQYYNPFSNGTLFDYLGVDLSGVYANNENFLSNIEFTDSSTNLFNDDMDINTIPYDLDSYVLSHILTVGDVEKFGWSSVSINIREFLKTHAILGMIYVNATRTHYIFPDLVSFYRVDTDDTPVWASYTQSSTRYKLDFDSETSKISSLPLRAYHSIYIDYFRDQNYISVNPCIDFSRDGNDIDWSQGVANVFDYLTMNYKSYEHDPYTSALPQAQRGEPVRYLPDSRVSVATVSGASDLTGQGRVLYTPSSASHPASVNLGVGSSGASPASGLHAELTVDLSAATIENLRFANALQKLKEREARSGGRYFELMEAIFGARIDDAKIDRPIFLGGDKTPIQVSEVLQTSATEVTTDQPLGQMAGRAVAIGNDDFIEYVTPDHGFFIEICAVLPRTNYQQGLLPMFTRKVRLDYPMPQFAQLGETQVPQSELWYSADESEDKKPFGFQSRYYDSKYQRDRTSGTFKDALAHWTWSRIFDNAPVAGKSFIEVHPDYRQFAVTDKSQEHVYIHMWHDIQVLRSLPVFGTPKL